MSFLINPYAFLAAGGDFESIATVTVGSGGASSIEFTSIPGTYQHLQLRIIGRSTAAVGPRAWYLRCNSDTGSNYASHRLQGDGSVASAGAFTSETYVRVYDNPAANATASVFSAGVIDILDYGSTTKTKTVRFLNGFDGNGSGYIGVQSGLWNNSGSAISGLTLTLEAGNFAQHSTAALYGIKAP